MNEMGYLVPLFSRPVDAEAATALLAADTRGESLLKTQ